MLFLYNVDLSRFEALASRAVSALLIAVETYELSALPAAKLIAVGLATIALAGSAIGIGSIFASLVAAVSRNPESANESVKYAYLGFALCESIALLALMIVIYILFVFGAD